MSTPPPTTTTVTAFADEWLPELTHPLANWPGHWFETADNPLAETILSTDHVYMKQLLDVLHLFDDDAARQNISPTDFHNREHIRFDFELQKPWSSKYINLFATAMFLRELVITSVWWSHLWRVREVTYTKRATNWSTDAWESIYTEFIVCKEKRAKQNKLERSLCRKMRAALLKDMPFTSKRS